MPDLAAPLMLLLLPLPLAMRMVLPRGRIDGPALMVPFAVPDTAPADWRLRRLALPLLAWICLVVALAGPRQVIQTAALPISGRDLIVALDLSGSMVREDFTLDGQAGTRLDVVKRAGGAFVRGRGGDRVALLVFGSEPYFATSFSYDVAAVAQKIDAAEIGVSGRATNISGALGLALKRMQDSDAASRVVILLSDGENTAGSASPLGAARLAQEMGVRVHTIAMGVEDTESAPGEQGVVDARTLTAIAEISGGQSYRVRSTADLLDVTRMLDRLETTERAGSPAEVYRALWIWPAGLALALCAALTWREAA